MLNISTICYGYRNKQIKKIWQYLITKYNLFLQTHTDLYLTQNIQQEQTETSFFQQQNKICNMFM